MNLKRILDTFIYFITLPLVVISYIFCPLTNDARIYLGVEHIAATYYPQFPQNVDLAWEIKPIANRMINYILYEIVNSVTPFINLNHFWFEFGIKLVAAIITLAVCWYFARQFKDVPYILPLTICAFFTPLNFSILQAEYWAVLFTMLAIALMLTDKPRNDALAGFMMVVVFLFKGITGLLIVPVLCAVWFFRNDTFKDKLRYFLPGYAAGFILFYLTTLTWWPRQIPDMIMAAKMAHVGFWSLETLIENMIYNLLVVYLYIPIICVGVVAGLIIYWYIIGTRRWIDILIFLALWASCLAIIFIQSEFFMYHYIVLLVPSMISIIMLADRARNVSLLAVLSMFFVFLVMSSYWGAGMQYERSFWGNKEGDAKGAFEKLPDLWNQHSILYLDPGDAPFYFFANSSCRYVCPLIVQRNIDMWNTTGFPQYWEEYNCIMAYQGEYIVMDNGGWFGWVNKSMFNVVGLQREYTNVTEDRVHIWGVINANYTKVYTMSWDIYKKKEGL